MLKEVNSMMTISRDNQYNREKNPRRKNSTRCSPENTRSDSVNDDDVKRYHGDGLIVRMDSNHRVLEIRGDGCRISLSENSGSVRVVGDGCRLRVNHNVGDIEYTGDGGRVFLGPDSSKEKVKFVGDDGKVILYADLDMESTIADQKEQHRTWDSRDSTGDRRNRGSGVRNTACLRKEVIQRAARYDEYRRQFGDCKIVSNQELRTFGSKQECLDNVTNDIKERNPEKYEKRNEETRKSSRHQTIVTTIITKIQNDGRFVRKRFDGPSLIINLTEDGDPARIASRTSNSEIK